MSDAPRRLEIAVNEARSQARLAQLRQGAAFGTAGVDDKRPQAWCEYGFPEDISFGKLYGLYQRNGVAHGAVDKLVQNCWKTNPNLIEGDEDDNDEQETSWEKATKAKFKELRIWRHFAAADVRRLVGRFSALILQFKDSAKWEDPVKKGANLVQIIPAWSGSLKVATWDTDEKSDNYGKPTLWQYSQVGIGDGQPGVQSSIHPDRIFILGDYSREAIGFLDPVYNNFVSIEKVEGGAGESFLKNAARQISMEFDTEVNFSQIAAQNGVSIKDLKQAFQNGINDINRLSDAALISQGAKVGTLTTTVPDPSPTYNINLQSIAAGLDIPSKILVGMQTGERASTEDQKYFNSRCQSRRHELSYEIHDFAMKLMYLGVIKTIVEFSSMWDDLNEATRGEKLDNAKKMSDINNTALATGELIFEAGEVREAAGYEPLETAIPLPEVEPVEEDPILDPEDEQDPDPTKVAKE